MRYAIRHTQNEWCSSAQALVAAWRSESCCQTLIWKQSDTWQMCLVSNLDCYAGPALAVSSLNCNQMLFLPEWSFVLGFLSTIFFCDMLSCSDLNHPARCHADILAMNLQLLARNLTSCLPKQMNCIWLKVIAIWETSPIALRLCHDWSFMFCVSASKDIKQLHAWCAQHWVLWCMREFKAALVMWWHRHWLTQWCNGSSLQQWLQAAASRFLELQHDFLHLI